MADVERVVIAAVAENGVIGNDGDIPWYEPADLRHFKDTTTGHPVIMGRTTYASLPDDYRPLPDRTNIVLTSRDTYGPDDVITAASIDEAFDAAAAVDDTAYVAGGASVYEQVLDQDRVDRMVLTCIPDDPVGDTYFPDWDDDDWTLADQYALSDEVAVNEYVRQADR